VPAAQGGILQAHRCRAAQAIFEVSRISKIIFILRETPGIKKVWYWRNESETKPERKLVAAFASGHSCFIFPKTLAVDQRNAEVVFGRDAAVRCFSACGAACLV
jgi:hypothetical protein